MSQFIREYPGFTVSSFYDELADHPDIMGELVADIQSRINVSNRKRGDFKAKPTDHPEDLKNWAKKNTATNKSKIAKGDAALRAAGIMS